MKRRAPPSMAKPAAAPDTLVEYRRKRDFTKTAEPAGTAKRAGGHERLRFVVQKHAASHLHFDFRLELDGAMKSWAVPKGPSLDPGTKRLAMQVEDHPIEYNTFEGTIPAGEYGGGTVMVWDRGHYESADGGGPDSLRRGYRAGKLDIVMHGKRLHGGFALVRTRGSDAARSDRAKPQWLLIKRSDEHADPTADIVATVTTSIASGRTMDEIAAGRRVWHSNRSARSTAGRKPPARSVPTSPASPATGPAASTTRAIAPATTPVPSARKAVRRSAMDPISAQLAAIERDGGNGTLRLGGNRTLPVSHLDKVYFPEDGYTKGDVMRYYAAMSRVVLPPIEDRPLVLRRFPGGIRGRPFYQHKAATDAPPASRVEKVRAGPTIAPRFIGGDLGTLLHTVQLGAISVDPWHARVQSLDTPDYAIIDLDPGAKAGFPRVIQVAHWVKEELDALDLRSAVKTSGGTGLHIFLPLPAGTPEEAARLLAQIVATRVAVAHPREATVERSVRSRRPDSVYVDYLQNIRGRTIAAAYCVRALDGAPVSTPLTWDELTATVRPDMFTIRTVPDRVARLGDIWKLAMRPPRSLGRLVTRALR